MKTTCRNIFITGTILIWLIKFGLRAWLYLPPYSAGCFLMGIAPNLLGSFLIPFAAYCLFENRQHFLARLFSIRSELELSFVCALGFVLVVINEYLQLYPLFGRTFDFYDILFSSVGALSSFFIFRHMARFGISEYPSPRKKFMPTIR